MRVAKLIDGINLKQEDKEYNSTKVISNFDNFDMLYYLELGKYLFSH